MRAVIASESAGFPPRLPPAGLLRRLAALFYDTLVVAALFMLTGFIVLSVTGGTAVPAGTNWFRALLLLVAGSYFCVSWKRGGQTLGMRAWRLRLVDPDGQPVSATATVLRLGAAAVAGLPAGLGYLWSVFDPERRAWHDRWTDTRIVVLPKAPRQS